MQTTPLKLGTVGDTTIAQRTDITAGFLGTSLISVISTRGSALSMLFLLTDPNSAATPVEVMELLARTADQRLARVLAGQ